MNPKITYQLNELFSNETLPEWQRSSRLLSLALEYCRAALEEPQERADLLLGLAELNQALKTGSASLGNLAGTLQQAWPSATLKQALEENRAAFAQRQKELANLQQQVTELEKMEAKHKEMEAECDRLRSRLDYLQKLSQTPQELEALRKQVAEKDDGDVAINIIIS